MTRPSPSRGARPVSPPERGLVTSLLTGFLREDVGGLRARGRLLTGSDGGLWLAVGALRVPVRPADPARGDQLGDLVARAPHLDRLDHRGPRRRRRARRLHAVVNLLAEELTGSPSLGDRPRFDALRVEATAALASTGLRRRARPAVLGRVRPRLLGSEALGWPGAVVFETLAAHRDHPFYPLSPARVGLDAARRPSLAPEHGPLLRLRWVRVPEGALEHAGRLPDWWPGGGSPLLPVHPAVDDRALSTALTEAGPAVAELVEDGLERVSLARLTLAGAIYITFVCLLPEFLILKYNVPFYFGGTSLLIIVVVTMDFMAQVQNYLMSQQYESLLKKANFKTSLGG